MKKLISILLCFVMLLGLLPLQAAAESYDRLPLDSEVSVNCKSAGDWKVFQFTPSESGIYIFSSSGSLDTLGYIALVPGEAENEYIKADGGQDNNFAVTYDMRAGTTYYLGATVLMGNTGTFKVKLIKFEVDDDTIYPITLGSSTAVTCYTEEKLKFYSLVPQTTGKYIYNSSGSYDTRGYIFDAYWRQIACSFDGGAGNNFKITLDLQEGETYYLGYTSTYTGTAKFNILCYMTTSISGIALETAPEKTTYIKDIDAKLVGDYVYHVDLNLMGFSFRVNYANGTKDVKTYTYGIRGLNCNPSQSVGLGDNYIRFDYMGKQSSFKISVKNSPVQSITMLQPPDKTVYYAEDVETAVNEDRIFNISLYGMVIRVQYTDGTTSDFTISSSYGGEIDYFYFDHVVAEADMRIGANTFTLTYYDKQLSFDVNYSLNSDNWQYEIVDDYAVATKYIGSESRAVVPEYLGGLPVKRIGDSCFEGNTTVTEVKMSNRITEIGEKAFYECTALKEITLPRSLESIGKQGLFKLTSLEKLNWNAPSLTISRENNTFAYMGKDTANGTTVDFGFSCTSIPANAFYCSASNYAPTIGSVIVGENVTAIGNNAFREVKGLTSVEWNATEITTSVGTANNIWYQAASDTSFTVTVGEYVASLPNNLFYNSNATRCPRVSSITALGNATTVSANTVKPNASVPLTVYCYYNEDSSVNSVYRFCADNSEEYAFSYELLDSPLDHIVMRSAPEKTDYIIGEALDLTGLVLYAVREDGSEEEVSAKVTAAGFDGNTLGTQTVTLSYSFIDRTKTVSYSVRVSEEPLVLDYLSIENPAQTTVYFEGDNFTSDGLQVSAHFTNGTTQDVTEFVVLSGYNMQSPGTQTVTAEYTYEEVSRSIGYSITVNEVLLTGIVITTQPTKRAYLVGESFDPAGISVTASYNNGSQKEVGTLCAYEGYNLSQKGSQNVAVTYSEKNITKSASFTISVSNDLTTLAISTPAATTQFVLGSTFSSEGLAVTAQYANGTQTDVTSLVTLSGYDMEAAGEQTVTVSYTEDGITKTASYSIQVLAVALESLRLVSAPTAQQYTREPFHTEGLAVHASYNNGTTEDVTESLVFTGFDNTTDGTHTITASYTYGGKSLSVQFSVYVMEKVPTGIAIATQPDKTAYLIGEALQTAGLAVNLVFDNGTREALPLSALSFAGFNSASTGTKTVTVSYTEAGNSFSNQFYVTVANYETAIAVTPPAKTQYFYGESWNNAGMNLKVTMADGSQKTVYSGYTVTGFDSMKPGEQTLLVSFKSAVTGETLTDTFTVTVKNFATAIAVSAAPGSAFYYGEALQLGNLSVTATMADGSSKALSADSLTIENFTPTLLGSQNLTAAYINEKGENLSDSFTLTVLNFETALSVAGPDNTTCFYGEALNTAGLAVNAVYADGSTKALTAADYTLTGYNAATLGAQQIFVGYTNCRGTALSGSFTVSVADYETAMVVTAPSKTQYYYGDNIDTAGLSAATTMASGAAGTLTAEQLNMSGYNAAALGEQSVTASYTNAKGTVLSDSFTVSVLNFEAALELVSTGKTDYSYGDAFDASGVSARLVMADGTKLSVAQSALSFEGFDTYLVGEQTITVSYTNVKGEAISTTYTVNVKTIGTSIHVSAPDKTDYFYGESLNTAGLAATLETIDGSSTPIDSAALSVTGFNPTKLGEQDVTVVYTTEGGQILKDRFKVTVHNFEQSIAVTKAGKTTFIYGDSFESGAIEVQAVMADGTTAAVDTAALSFTGYNDEKAGAQSVSVSFTNAKGQSLTTSYEVEVLNYETTLMLTAPTKKAYFCGDSLDTTGMKALAMMADKSVVNVDVTRLYCTGFNSAVPGEQTISVNLDTVKGETLTKTYKVTVNNYESAISVSAPLKTAYFYGDSLNLGGMKVTATMADGSVTTLANASCSVSGFAGALVGTQTITVAFTNAKEEALTDTFTVEVQNFETALSVTAPLKTVYDYGEALNTTGLTATAVMADGSSRTVATDELRFENYDAEAPGTQTVSVILTGAKGDSLSDSFTVEVKEAEAPHTHFYLAEVTAPTCTQQGYTTHTCSCGDSYVDSYVPATGHSPAAAVRENEKAATCAAAGSYEEVVYCSVCKEELSRQTKAIEALAHTPAAPVRENETAATCAQAGSYEEVIYCTVCAAQIERTQKTINPLGHDYRAQTTEPTCTQQGYTTYSCSRCTESYKADYVAAKGHTAGAAVRENETAATCAAAGSYDEVVYCSVCNAELSRQTKAIAKLAHTAGAVVKENEKAATCAAAGSYDEVVYCSVCNAELSRETKAIAKLAHTAGAAVRENEKAATCAAAGSYDEVVYCSVCTAELSRQTKAIAKLEHTAGAVVKENEKAATCTAIGSFEEVTYCTVCKAELSRVEKYTAKRAHTEGAAVKENEKAPTCTQAGSYEEVTYCTLCKAEMSRKAKTVAALGHTLAASVRENEIAATCTAAGSYDEVVYCTVCKAEVLRINGTLPAKGHHYAEAVTAPTSTALGYTTHSCEACGDSFIDSYTAPKGKQTLKLAASTAAAIKVQWNKVANATGYQVQISTKDGKKWSTYATIKTNKTLNYTFKSLAAGNAYKFRVRFYIAQDGVNYFSPWSTTFTTATLPTGTSITKLTAGSKAFTAQWKKNTAVTGYQIQYSLKSNFSGAKTVTVKSNKTLKTTVKKLNAKKVYYVRVRTYKTIAKVNYFSAWSKTVKVKTK